MKTLSYWLVVLILVTGTLSLTVYVDPTQGSDTNSGSSAAPVKTIYKAFTLFTNSSDFTLMLNPGTHIISSNSPIRFASYLEGTIKGNDAIVTGQGTFSERVMYIISKSLTIDGVSFYQFATTDVIGSFIAATGDLTLKNCKFESITVDGFVIPIYSLGALYVDGCSFLSIYSPYGALGNSDVFTIINSNVNGAESFYYCITEGPACPIIANNNTFINLAFAFSSLDITAVTVATFMNVTNCTFTRVQCAFDFRLSGHSSRVVNAYFDNIVSNLGGSLMSFFANESFTLKIFISRTTVSNVRMADYTDALYSPSYTDGYGDILLPGKYPVILIAGVDFSATIKQSTFSNITAGSDVYPPLYFEFGPLTKVTDSKFFDVGSTLTPSLAMESNYCDELIMYNVQFSYSKNYKSGYAMSCLSDEEDGQFPTTGNVSGITWSNVNDIQNCAAIPLCQAMEFICEHGSTPLPDVTTGLIILTTSAINITVPTTTTTTTMTTTTGLSDVQAPSTKSKTDTGLIVGVVVGVVGAVLLAVLIVVLILFLRKKGAKKDHENGSITELHPVGPSNVPSQPESQTPYGIAYNYNNIASAPPNSDPARKSIAPAAEDFGELVLTYDELIVGPIVGAGAFGEVLRGEYRGTDVAIKKVSAEALSKNKNISRDQVLNDFKSEALVMKQLPPHPNVVIFLGITLPPEPLTMVLEFCPGGSLKSLLSDTNVNISDEQKVAIVTDIARGMYHLHSGKKGFQVIHRDLAARNILVKDRKGYKCAVSDFGMARLKVEDEDNSKTVQEMGPVKWMAPEAITSQTYSIKTDVFSFGVVIYEIVTRGDPWPGVNGAAAVAQVITGKRMEIPKDTPTVLATLMTQCWNVDPEQRPSFKEIIDEIKRDNGSSFIHQPASSSKIDFASLSDQYAVAAPQQQSNATDSHQYQSFSKE